MTTTLNTPAPPQPARAMPPARTTPPKTASLWRQARVLARRNLIKTWRTPEALIDVTLQPVIFLGLFTYVFGGAITGGDRGDYLQYLLPGLLGQTIALASVSLGQNLNADIEKGVFDRFRSLPIGRSAPLLGGVLADLVRYVTLFVIMIGVGSLMGFDPTSWTGVLGALALSMGFALCFGWVSVYLGMIVRTPSAVQGIMFMLVLPLSFGSSAFVPIDSMPGWLQVFANANPISHLVGAVRGMMVGGSVSGHLLWTLVWMAGLLAVFAPLAVRAYRQRA